MVAARRLIAWAVLFSLLEIFSGSLVFVTLKRGETGIAYPAFLVFLTIAGATFGAILAAYTHLSRQQP